jgi:O-methyltransferase
METKAARLSLERSARGVARAAWLAPSVRRCLPYTMLRPGTLLQLGVHARHARDFPGAFVECGVWRGGASFLMADVLLRMGDNRPIWMLDSFEGMPPVEPIDGERALRWQQEGDSRTNDATATVEEVEATRERLGLSNTRLVRGWFEESLPSVKEDIGPIALLRLDCDWHAAVTTCLNELYDQVVPGGFLLIDDYYTFDGCAIALHEFLGGRRLSHRIRQDHGTGVVRKA